MRLVLWVGSPEAPEYALLKAGAGERGDVVAVDSLEDALHHRAMAGIATGIDDGVAVLRACHLADGLAKAVGCADTVAFSSAIPQPFGFCASVGGIVAAVREVTGMQYLDGSARIDARGPEAWCAVAGLTQLRLGPIDGNADPMTGAIAHRLGVELQRVADPSVTFWGMSGETAITGIEVPTMLVKLHTVAAQLRVFYSVEPNEAAMRALI